MRKLSVRLDPVLARQLDQAAKAANCSRSEFVRNALRRRLAILQFRALRNESLPLGKAAGYLTDADVFRSVS